MWCLKDLISFSSAVSAWNLLAIAEQLWRLQFFMFHSSANDAFFANRQPESKVKSWVNGDKFWNWSAPCRWLPWAAWTWQVFNVFTLTLSQRKFVAVSDAPSEMVLYCFQADFFAVWPDSISGPNRIIYNAAIGACEKGPIPSCIDGLKLTEHLHAFTVEFWSCSVLQLEIIGCRIAEPSLAFSGGVGLECLTVWRSFWGFHRVGPIGLIALGEMRENGRIVCGLAGLITLGFFNA